MANTKFIEKIEKKSTVNTIVDAIIDAIVSQKWKSGDKIPTEMELAEAFAVGRNSVREAVKVLVAMGMLEIRRADGTYVTDHFSERMLNPLLYSMALEADMERSLAELRTVYGIDSLELAVAHATEEDCKKIDEAFQNLKALLEKDDSTPDELLNADIAFHDTVSAATHNVLFQRVYKIILRLSRESRIMELNEIISNHEKQEMIEMHRNERDVILQRKKSHIYEEVQGGYKYLDIKVNPKGGKDI